MDSEALQRCGLHSMLLDQMLLHIRKKSIETLLPLFHVKAATPEMIRHGMELVKMTTEHLNPYQIPVLVVDQPLYVPEILGEDKFVVMLGGLHIEMALWSNIGDLLFGSGWPETLNEAGLVKTRSSDSFSENIQSNKNKICPLSYCCCTGQYSEASL